MCAHTKNSSKSPSCWHERTTLSFLKHVRSGSKPPPTRQGVRLVSVVSCGSFLTSRNVWCSQCPRKWGTKPHLVSLQSSRAPPSPHQLACNQSWQASWNSQNLLGSLLDPDNTLCHSAQQCKEMRVTRWQMSLECVHKPFTVLHACPGLQSSSHGQSLLPPPSSILGTSKYICWQSTTHSF